MPLADAVRPNFGHHELACKCCGRLVANKKALDTLQALRDLLGVPLTVVSGFRCDRHNSRVGGAPQSLHLQGQAFDLAWPDVPALKLLACAWAAGFSGVGFYPTFVHLDTGPPRHWIG